MSTNNKGFFGFFFFFKKIRDKHCILKASLNTPLMKSSVDLTLKRALSGWIFYYKFFSSNYEKSLHTVRD